MNSAGVSGMFSDHDDEVREVLRERPLMGELPYVFLDGLWLKRLIAGPADIGRQVSIRGRYRNHLRRWHSSRRANLHPSCQD
jgi:hypothetical protein